eukprot:TRINITY_DN774305_c0_g1_i1.p1 TRINITY_DN774305_c0_g1~~TRINITY_DN774305_c0_g1_i1.p1  ORF type:complete len:270 (+),score=72.91 TRINITY_DN774305_c0_g1_i1:104-913(+)
MKLALVRLFVCCLLCYNVVCEKESETMEFFISQGEKELGSVSLEKRFLGFAKDEEIWDEIKKLSMEKFDFFPEIPMKTFEIDAFAEPYGSVCADIQIALKDGGNATFTGVLDTGASDVIFKSSIFDVKNECNADKVTEHKHLTASGESKHPLFCCSKNVGLDVHSNGVFEYPKKPIVVCSTSNASFDLLIGRSLLYNLRIAPSIFNGDIELVDIKPKQEKSRCGDKSESGGGSERGAFIISDNAETCSAPEDDSMTSGGSERGGFIIRG